jgi:hypothetical protein
MPWNVHVDVFEVVLPCAPHADEVHAAIVAGGSFKLQALGDPPQEKAALCRFTRQKHSQG